MTERIASDVEIIKDGVTIAVHGHKLIAYRDSCFVDRVSCCGEEVAIKPPGAILGCINRHVEDHFAG